MCAFGGERATERIYQLLSGSGEARLGAGVEEVAVVAGAEDRLEAQLAEALKGDKSAAQKLAQGML